MSNQFKPEQAVLMVVDMQERLLPVIHERERVVARSAVLIQALKILGVPLIWAEQYKKGLGETDPTIREAIGEAVRPLEKLAFGCLGDPALTTRANEIRPQGTTPGGRQLVLCGIETHVCILQTALKALNEGWTVFLAEDATSSRREADRETALRRLEQGGVIPATVEMLIMEGLGVGSGAKFKSILPLVKEL